MVKLVYNDINDALLKAASGQLSFLFETMRDIRKSASSSAFSAKLINDNLPDQDHFGVHLIAMGAGEWWDKNRNGDWFPEEMLKRSHHTFVTNGHFFREHNNRDPKKAIGIVKASAYNDDMHRVELIIHGDKRKAEPEYERAKAGKVSAYSMSVSVPYDVCSCCGKKSAKTIYYCGHLRDHMNEYLPKFKKFAYAENPKGTFFDISDVANNADRTAFYLQYKFHPDDEAMAKAASVHGFQFSEHLATAAGVCIPDSYPLSFQNPEHAEMLTKLASLEAHIENLLRSSETSPEILFVKSAAKLSFHPESLAEADLEQLKALPPELVFVQLAKRASILPFIAFCAYTGQQTLEEASISPVIQKAATLLPTMFREHLPKSIDIDMESLFTPDMEKAGCFVDRASGEFLDKLARNALSADHELLARRILLNSMRAEAEAAKCASVLTPEEEGNAIKLASIYGTYKVAAISAISEFHKLPVDDPTLLALTLVTI